MIMCVVDLLMLLQKTVCMGCQNLLNILVKASMFQSRTRKGIGFKSLRLNCSDVTEVNIKMRNVNYC